MIDRWPRDARPAMSSCACCSPPRQPRCVDTWTIVSGFTRRCTKQEDWGFGQAANGSLAGCYCQVEPGLCGTTIRGDVLRLRRGGYTLPSADAGLADIDDTHMKLAVFLPNWIGDVVMATPTLRAVRNHFGPHATLIGVLRPYVADVLAGTSWLDERILYNPRAKDRRLRTWSMLKTLRAARPDAVLLLTNSLRTGVLAWASGAGQRIGYARNARGPLLTHKLYHPRVGRKWLPTPAIDAYLQLAYALGCRPEPPRLELATLNADEAQADAIWNKYKLPPGDQVVMLNSGGAFGAAKLWPAEYFAELARRIAIEQRMAVLVNCGPSERAIAAEIVRRAAHAGVVSLAEEEVPIGLNKACIRRSRLLVTTDSGPRFFAVAFGVPVVSLFGPTHIAWSQTHWAGEICLQREVPCGPCMQRTCPLEHHRCMRELSVDEVYAAVKRQLHRDRSECAA